MRQVFDARGAGAEEVVVDLIAKLSGKTEEERIFLWVDLAVGEEDAPFRR